jgi:hypothetical protein
LATEQAVAKRFKEKLRSLGYTIEEQPLVGQTSPDFLVTSPTGTSAVVEAKMWDSSPASLRHASDLARLYASSSGAFGSYILLPSVPEALVYQNVISPDNLTPLLSQLKKPPSRTARRPSVRKAPSPRSTAFVAMPFEAEFDKVYELAVKPTIARAGHSSIRIDRQYQPGDVVRQIKRAISLCRFVVADLSTSNPNVLFEVGYAEARKRPVIQLCSTSFKKLPFDVRNNNTIAYKPSRLDLLRRRLAKTMGNV